MFSDHFETIDKLPAKKMFLAAAILVLVCQLIAMVLVAGGQVEKAQFRQASHASFQSAYASCIENNRGVALKDCARLVQPDAVQTATKPLLVSADSDAQGFELVRLADQR